MSRQLAICKEACVNRLRDVHGIPEPIGALMFDETIKKAQATTNQVDTLESMPTITRKERAINFIKRKIGEMLGYDNHT